MTKGTKVICVDDKFDPEVVVLYKQLPKKDEVYTIRDCKLGREKLVAKDKDGNIIKGAASESVTVYVLLEEIRNDPDPIQMEQYRQELGFKAERFREIDTHEAEEYTEERMVMFAGKTIETPDLVAA